MNVLKDKRILIVEDDEILREVISEEFLNCESHVTVAHGGHHALQKIKEENLFDLIVTDVQMPDGDGVYLLDHLQTMTFSQRPTIIMVSGYSDLPKEDLIKKGADAVLPKPFELNELIDATKHLLLKKR